MRCKCGVQFCYCCGRRRGGGGCDRRVTGCDFNNCYLENNPGPWSNPTRRGTEDPGMAALRLFHRIALAYFVHLVREHVLQAPLGRRLWDEFLRRHSRTMLHLELFSLRIQVDPDEFGGLPPLLGKPAIDADQGRAALARWRARGVAFIQSWLPRLRAAQPPAAPRPAPAAPRRPGAGAGAGAAATTGAARAGAGAGAQEGARAWAAGAAPRPAATMAAAAAGSQAARVADIVRRAGVEPVFAELMLSMEGSVDGAVRAIQRQQRAQVAATAAAVPSAPSFESLLAPAAAPVAAAPLQVAAAAAPSAPAASSGLRRRAYGNNSASASASGSGPASAAAAAAASASASASSSAASATGPSLRLQRRLFRRKVDAGAYSKAEVQANPYLKALWQDDDDAFRCYECEHEFSLFRRRHHCRGCGLIFCKVRSVASGRCAARAGLTRLSLLSVPCCPFSGLSAEAATPR